MKMAICGAFAVFAIGNAHAGTGVWTPYSSSTTFPVLPSAMTLQSGADYAIAGSTFYRAPRTPDTSVPAWSSTSAPTNSGGFDNIAPLISTSDTVVARTINWGWGASKDGGLSWTWEGRPDVNGVPTRTLVSTESLDAVHAGSSFYVADWWGVAASTDGSAWRRLRGTEGTATVANSIAAVGTHLFINESAFGASISRSDDGGRTWLDVALPDTAGQGHFVENRGFTVIGQDLYAVVNRNIYKTPDLGATWTRIDSSVLPGAGAVYHIEGVGTSLFAFNGSGAFETVDGGATWTSRNTGLPYDGLYLGSEWSDGKRLFATETAYEGNAQLFVLTPVPEPGGLALMLAGLLVSGGLRARGRLPTTCRIRDGGRQAHRSA